MRIAERRDVGRVVNVYGVFQVHLRSIPLRHIGRIDPHESSMTCVGHPANGIRRTHVPEDAVRGSEDAPRSSGPSLSCPHPRRGIRLYGRATRARRDQLYRDPIHLDKPHKASLARPTTIIAMRDDPVWRGHPE
jgi:hypothetical protein